MRLVKVEKLSPGRMTEKIDREFTGREYFPPQEGYSYIVKDKEGGSTVGFMTSMVVSLRQGAGGALLRTENSEYKVTYLEEE